MHSDEITFGRFRLDLRRRKLSRDGETIRLHVHAIGILDTDEVIIRLAKTVADLTCRQNSTVRQQVIETLMREIMEYDAVFRREYAAGAVTSVARL